LVRNPVGVADEALMSIAGFAELKARFLIWPMILFFPLYNECSLSLEMVSYVDGKNQ